MPLHAIVGVSAGAIVAAYYAAVGLELEEMIQDAETFRGRHLLAHSLSVRCGPRLRPPCDRGAASSLSVFGSSKGRASIGSTMV